MVYSRSVRTIGTAIALAAMCGNHVAAQGPRTIPSTIACSDCRLTLTRIATLGSASDPVSPTRFETNVVRDSRKRYYLAPTADYAVMAVYDSIGRFIKTLGREGQGPGEYGFIMRAEVIAGDSIIVLDGGNARVTLLSPNHEYMRSFLMAGRFTRAFRMPPGPNILVQGKVPTREAAGLPLHLLAADGTILRSFGSVTPETHRYRPQIDIRHVARAGPHEVWTAKLDRYEIERWTLDGAMTRSFKRDPDWFRPWDYEKETAQSLGLTGPLTLAIWQDSSGLLWTMIRVPSLNAKKTDYSGPERPLPPFEIEDANIDTMIEVIDPSKGALLASQRFSHFLVGHIERDLIYSLRSTQDGDLRVDIWHIQLTRAQRR